jgi:serine protease Do
MTAIDDLQSAIGRVAERVAPSVVRIGRHGGRGCGVVVGDGLVLTNAHNLRDMTTLVTFADGRSVQSRAQGVDVDSDLVVLSVDTGSAPVLDWADGDVDLGAPVFAVASIPDGHRVTVGTPVVPRAPRPADRGWHRAHRPTGPGQLGRPHRGR